MDDPPVSLDARRGMSAQKETELRRRTAGVRADQAALKERQAEFEEGLISTPAGSRKEAVIKAKYLIELYGATAEGADPRRALLIVRALDDLDRLFNLKPAGLRE